MINFMRGYRIIFKTSDWWLSFFAGRPWQKRR